MTSSNMAFEILKNLVALQLLMEGMLVCDLDTEWNRKTMYRFQDIDNWDYVAVLFWLHIYP